MAKCDSKTQREEVEFFSRFGEKKMTFFYKRADTGFEWRDASRNFAFELLK